MVKPKHSVAVLGGGSWGTALIKVLQHNGINLKWWVRRECQKERIIAEKHNPDYLSHTDIDTDNLIVSTVVQEVVAGSDVVILAVPSAFLNTVFEKSGKDLFREKAVISAVKGLETVSLQPVYQWLVKNFEIPENKIGVIGGPCHSEEVVMQRRSYLTLGVSDHLLGEEVADLLQTPWLTVRISNDVKGISIASVLKNVYGILAGVANGLRYGDNFMAVLVTNMIMEMDAVLHELTGNGRSINSSVYAGDLMVTAYSRFSRNWVLGNMIGKGYTVQSALLELGMIAEGYYAVAALGKKKDFPRHQYPLISAVYSIICEHVAPAPVVHNISSILK